MSVSTENSKESSSSGKRKGCYDWPLIEDRNELQMKVEKHPLWELVDKETHDKIIHTLSRKFVTKNFQCALDFIASCGIVAETFGHHPDLHLSNYRNVEVVVYSHTQGGITDNDFALIKAIDESALVVYSPKWLKEHPNAALTSATLTK